MKIKWQQGNNSYYITQYVESVTWSGSATQCSRSLEITVANSLHDANMKPLDIKLGDYIMMYEDGLKYPFVGVVSSRERIGTIGTVTYTAYDFMNYLLKSQIQKVYRNTTAEAITKNLCKQLSIDTTGLAKTGVKIKKLILDDAAFYDGIIKAYRKAAKKTGKKYMPAMAGKKVSVIEKGISSGVLLKEDANITSSSYSENLDSMVNQVIIYNEAGKKIGVVKNKNWVNKYGIFQQTYTKEEGENAKTAAKNMLEGIAKEGSIEAIGDIRAISGYSLQIQDKATGLKGEFWIETDTHTWTNGIHTMSLELSFRNVMESSGS